MFCYSTEFLSCLESGPIDEIIKCYNNDAKVKSDVEEDVHVCVTCVCDHTWQGQGRGYHCQQALQGGLVQQAG